MSYARWLDHVPPWLAWMALLSTGVYEIPEMAFMAVPLALALGVEAVQWELRTWRRAMELIALGAFLAMVFARVGLVPTVVYTLFLLCGVRLALPRELAQRRQLLLMGFLIFLTTAIATTELGFLFWSLAWVAAVALILLQHTWEGSARYRRGPMQPAPLWRPLRWTAAVLALAVPFFGIMPRLAVGLRPLPIGIRGFMGAQAGMSDHLDLTGSGPIGVNNAVILRILPVSPLSPQARAKGAANMTLLRGLALESLDRQRWEPAPGRPNPLIRVLSSGALSPHEAYDFFLSPSRVSVLPLPYGPLLLEMPQGTFPRSVSETAVRVPARSNPLPFRLCLDEKRASLTIPGGPLDPKRRTILLHPGDGNDSVRAWVDAVAPGITGPRELADRLEQEFRTFRYTLENPSGSARNPLQDFLGRTRAGHCEYFASAAAIAFRYRGVMSRVVNGYRLGPWIDEGGYWLVTQNEAHSWVEYYDRNDGVWRVSDPTPSAPPSGLAVEGLWSTLQRWTDAIRFRWDRHVVRFSDEDQQAGLSWARERIENLSMPRLPSPSRFQTALGILLAVAFAGLWSLRKRLRAPARDLSPYALRPLRPLVRVAGRTVPPSPGETLHAWLDRLAEHQPSRATRLWILAREADRVAYGGTDPTILRNLVQEERKAWREASGR